MKDVKLDENSWTKTISERLQKEFSPSKIETSTLQPIPYSYEIDRYNQDWEPVLEGINSTEFQTDLVVYEHIGDEIKPRVIIEAKINSISTHDAITYSHKAEMHKSITPYLRYGIMIGNRGQYSLPGRLYRHGTNFDFMFCFEKEEPSEEEWGVFVKMIKDEIKYSRLMEEMLRENRHKDRKQYFMLQKKLVLKEK